MKTATPEAVLNANVYEVAVETPLHQAPRLSARLGSSLLLKREDLQSIFSFKIRGAYNMMSRLPRASLNRGVIAASAGNHAQGVALAGRQLSAPVTIVMPLTTPQIKVDAVRNLGAEVVLSGESYDEAETEAWRVSRRRRLTFVHAYDNADVIAGQGTIGMEILHQHRPPIGAIYVPVGGGGLIAGIAAYVKSVRPETLVIGVEPVDSDAMARSLRSGRRVRLAQVGQFADGVAVSRVGAEPFRLARRYVDEIVLVDTDRDLRRDQGRVRGHARRRRAVGSAVGGGCQAARRGQQPPGKGARRGTLGSERQLRSAPLRRRARGAR